jgi:ATP-dependent Lhr-like helicase
MTGGVSVGPDLAQVLSDLEDRELPLLNWGVVDGVFSHAEVRDVVASRLGTDGHPDDVEDVIDGLLDLALIIDVPDRPGYRTRLAEIVRLAALNRQLFGRGTGAWWSGGARLVSDFRLDVRPRSYPRRDLTRTELAADLASAGVSIAAEQEPVLAALTASAAELSRFQVDATREILASLAREKTSGVIVSAGTGSGKTLAFYLPAMLWLSERVAKGDYRTQVLALYPRKELLKDQLAEALHAASQASQAIRGRSGRDLRLGAFYGDTPQTASWLSYRSFQKSWPARAGGRVCPYLSCPADGCGSEVIWPDASIAKGAEELRCTKCSWTVGGDRLVLTRESMQSQPPDLLFTTTEMLNRSSSNKRTGKLFGWNPTVPWRPRLLLLDEVHTYEGVHGAQVGLLLRRWKHAVGRPVTVVGLSATLGRAPEFLSELAGINLSDVEHVEPKPEDLVFEGRQYQLVLRGDPLSGASLLSTSIQTVMLLARSLDLRGTGSGLYGSKAFVFTDNLDVVNRLFHDLRECAQRTRGVTS